jgi:hypothetical protein
MRLRCVVPIAICLHVLTATAFCEEEPSLPPGLGEGPTAGGEEPSLPEGLGGDTLTPTEAAEDDEGGGPLFDVTGFWTLRGGLRTQNDPYERDSSLGESRLHLELGKAWTRSALWVKTDFLFDPESNDYDIDLEEGRGWFDLREANYAITPVDFMDVKVGRQILTWGTGDLLFINDMFPKDWNSFFIGRDAEYLKAPSDAAKVSFFSSLANLNVVYVPRFDSDHFIDGRRVSYWNAGMGRLAGRDAVTDAEKPDDWFEDDEVALRLYKNVSGYELAGYGYRGYRKSPGGSDPSSGKAIFPELSVYGASFRGNILKGVGNIEFGYYDSREDSNGDDPFIRNSEVRVLLGYEREVGRDFTAGVQYYLEYMLDHDEYIASLPAGMRAADEDRHVFTLRLTKLLMRQNLKLSLFTYYSPSDQDAYVRPNIHYKINDSWSAEVGGNVFLGEEDHTFFGQFEQNSNVYAGLRWSF